MPLAPKLIVLLCTPHALVICHLQNLKGDGALVDQGWQFIEVDTGNVYLESIIATGFVSYDLGAVVWVSGIGNYKDSLFIGNYAVGGHAGAIDFNPDDIPVGGTVQNCKFEENRSGYGGAIHVHEAIRYAHPNDAVQLEAAELNDRVFCIATSRLAVSHRARSCSAHASALAQCLPLPSRPFLPQHSHLSTHSVVFIDCTYQNNTAEGDGGGAIYLDADATLVIIGEFCAQDNTALGSYTGGFAYLEEGANLTFSTPSTQVGSEQCFRWMGCICFLLKACPPSWLAVQLTLTINH